MDRGGKEIGEGQAPTAAQVVVERKTGGVGTWTEKEIRSKKGPEGDLYTAVKNNYRYYQFGQPVPSVAEKRRLRFGMKMNYRWYRGFTGTTVQDRYYRS